LLDFADGGDMQIGLCAARSIFAALLVATPWIAQAADKAKPGDSAQLARGN
jgi:hypothetical protein